MAGPIQLYYLIAHSLFDIKTFQKLNLKMKHSILALAIIGAVAARPTGSMSKREVPQEHSHENILSAVNTLLFKNNPDDIQDAVFGLLGNAAATNGKGNIADPGMHSMFIKTIPS